MKEIWKPIIGFEGLYEVSNLGRIRGLDRLDSLGKRIRSRIKGTALGTGYLWVNLWKNGKGIRIPVHHLVAAAFLGPRPKGFDVHHLDETRINNRSSNLQYWPRIAHMPRGIKHGCSKLTEKDIKYIRKMYKQKYRGLGRELAKKFNVGYFTIWRVVTYRSWIHI